mgnify:CR=1 FL=1
MILLMMVCESSAANTASEHILTHCANPVLMVFAQNHQMIENSQTSMSNTGIVQPKLSKSSYENKTKHLGFNKIIF